MKRLLTVKIPATSANLGPGFDSLGLALDLWNTFELHRDDAAGGGGADGIVVESHGEGAASLPTDSSHLVAQTMLGELERLGGIPSPWSIKIVCRNEVPCASGLGSSSTAVLAGLIFAHALADPKPIASRQAGADRHRAARSGAARRPWRQYRSGAAGRFDRGVDAGRQDAGPPHPCAADAGGRVRAGFRVPDQRRARRLAQAALARRRRLQHRPRSAGRRCVANRRPGAVARCDGRPHPRAAIVFRSSPARGKRAGRRSTAARPRSA